MCRYYNFESCIKKYTQVIYKYYTLLFQMQTKIKKYPYFKGYFKKKLILFIRSCL